MLGTITGVTDKQQPRSWLEKAISSLCVLGISQLKEHKVDLSTKWFKTHQILMQSGFRRSVFFLKIKQLVPNTGIQGKRGNSLQQKRLDFKALKKKYLKLLNYTMQEHMNSCFGPDQRSI